MKSQLLIALTCMLAAGTAFAQGKTTVVTIQDGKVIDEQRIDNPVPVRAFNTFAETDTNEDGRVSPEEAHEAGILTFASADLNADGWLDQQEYEAVASGVTELPAPE